MSYKNQSISVVAGGYGSPFPVLVDLDGDGKSEILFGFSAFNFDGTVRWDARRVSPATSIYQGGSVTDGATQPADLNLDGIPEIVAGPSALDRNGKALWSWRTLGDVAARNYIAQRSVNDGPWVDQFRTNVPLGDGWTAVANLDNDPFPEIIVVSPVGNSISPGPARRPSSRKRRHRSRDRCSRRTRARRSVRPCREASIRRRACWTGHRRQTSWVPPTSILR